MIRPSIHLFPESHNPLYAQYTPCSSQTRISNHLTPRNEKEIMPIDIIHPHISHHDNYFIINNPAIYRTNLLQFLQSCISGSGSPKPAFQPQPTLLRTSSSSEITLLTTGPQAPNITLTPSAALFGGAIGDESAQDKRFLSVPGVDLVRRMVREREKERRREGGCEGSYRCRCRGCGKKRGARIAAIKRRRERRERDAEEGERSEVEG